MTQYERWLKQGNRGTRPCVPRKENIEIKEEFYSEELIETVKLLTHDKEKESYEDYIIKIFSGDDYYAQEAKRADIKDHLSREETLTQKLKDKYYPIIKYVL